MLWRQKALARLRSYAGKASLPQRRLSKGSRRWGSTSFLARGCCQPAYPALSAHGCYSFATTAAIFPSRGARAGDPLRRGHGAPVIPRIESAVFGMAALRFSGEHWKGSADHLSALAATFPGTAR